MDNKSLFSGLFNAGLTKEEVDKKLKQSTKDHTTAFINCLNIIKYNQLKRMNAVGNYLEENKESIDDTVFGELNMILEYFNSMALEDVDSSINALELTNALIESKDETKH